MSISCDLGYQIDKAKSCNVPSLTQDEQIDGSEDDDVDEVLYGVDDDSQTDTDSDDQGSV